MENINVKYVHIMEQTDEEKLAMYMKLSKREIALMLIQNQKIIENMGRRIENEPFIPQYPVYPQWPPSPFYNPNDFIVTCSSNGTTD